MKKAKTSRDLLAFRKEAEKKLRQQAARLKDLSSRDAQSLIHELGTHQIELEMQNEELRRTQMDLEAMRTEYFNLFNFAPVGYFTFDERGTILAANITGASQLGRERASLLKQPFAHSVAGGDVPLFLAHLKEVFGSTKEKACELRCLRKDRSVFFARMESVALDEGFEGHARCLTAVSDITKLKQVQEALRKAKDELEIRVQERTAELMKVNEELETEIAERRRAEQEILKFNKELEHRVKERTAELEAVNKELEAFSYTISHDLKNPLRSIEGFTRAIIEDYTDRLDDTGKDYLNRVTSACQKMNQLIEAILTLARFTRREFLEKKVNLSGLAEVIAYELRKEQPERRVEFAVAKGVTARGDTEMLRIVLENLLGNAWKFTGKHPSAKIEFGVTRIDGKEAYFVRDDGAGFAVEFADKLFLPFQRLHTASEFPGIGIGLAIAHRIISRHGGKIWAESTPEKGATFYFTLE